MSSINIASPHIIQDYQKLALVGFSGVAAVTAQTLSLSWIHNIFEAQTKTGEQFTQMLRRIFTKRGIKSLYQGEFSKYRYSAFARFGDLISNVTVIDFFKNHQDSAIRQTPIFAQTLLSWTLASVWRFSILPLDVLSAQNLRGSFSANRLLTKLKYRKQKRVKSDINPLYSWLLVQNYLMAYTASVSYKQNAATAVLRNTLIGFASMSAFDLYKSVSNKIFGKIISQKYTFSGKKTTLRGLYGVVFCNVTQLFSQFSNQAHI